MIVARKKLAPGHYHVTDEAGQVYWVARVEVDEGRRYCRVLWQVGEVGADGFEDPPFDAGETMADCLRYCGVRPAN